MNSHRTMLAKRWSIITITHGAAAAFLLSRVGYWHLFWEWRFNYYGVQILDVLFLVAAWVLSLGVARRARKEMLLVGSLLLLLEFSPLHFYCFHPHFIGRSSDPVEFVHVAMVASAIALIALGLASLVRGSPPLEGPAEPGGRS